MGKINRYSGYDTAADFTRLLVRGSRNLGPSIALSENFRSMARTWVAQGRSVSYIRQGLNLAGAPLADPAGHPAFGLWDDPAVTELLATL